MYLKRVRVPNFRVLKDVDITFESEFFPKIFPLGSINGGGKSTLLQLIFILLHCAAYPEKMQFVRNLLARYVKPYSSNLDDSIASFEISDEHNKTIKLNFLLLDADNFIEYYGEKFVLNSPSEEHTEKFDLFKTSILELDELKKEEVDTSISSLEQKIITLKEEYSGLKSDKKKHILLSNSIQELANSLKTSKNKLNTLKEKFQEINKCLAYYDLYGLCSVPDFRDPKKSRFLVCQYEGMSDISPNAFFESLATQTFLVAPPTQIFLFLPSIARKSLFKNSDPDKQNVYQQVLEESKIDLKNFSAYDFMPVDLILNAFKQARDLDFAEKVSSGDYGHNYEKLSDELNLLLGNKQVQVEPDLSGIKFFIESDGEKIELYPEDLSHGELKRLNLYLWLKLNNIKDSIVLIDEIEIALHPDWQYQIVRDLEEWEPSNQYILATHSYELCQALTPAHVKELEPKLITSNIEFKNVQPHY